METQNQLQHCYLLSIEEPGDYIFTIAGVVVVLPNQKFSLFCPSAQYNRIRAALNRHTWTDLEKGVVFRDTAYRVEDITAEMAKRGWRAVSSIPAILTHLYESNPRHLFFLQQHLLQL